MRLAGNLLQINCGLYMEDPGLTHLRNSILLEQVACDGHEPEPHRKIPVNSFGARFTSFGESAWEPGFSLPVRPENSVHVA